MRSVHCIQLSVSLMSFPIAFVLIVLFVYVVHCKVSLEEGYLVVKCVTY